jgi:PBP1b-binding outer membrane lipoprotein LpoB
MKKTLSLVSLIIAMFLMTGCGEETKTVEYYKANIEEAKADAQKCKESKKNGEFDNEDFTKPSVKLQNCRNAMTVVIRIKHRPIIGDEPVLKTW